MDQVRGYKIIANLLIGPLKGEAKRNGGCYPPPNHVAYVASKIIDNTLTFNQGRDILLAGHKQRL